MSRKNLSQLSSAKFSIVKHRGDLNSVTLDDGTKVTRQPYMFVPEYGGLIETAPYDNHFIFANDIRKKNYIGFQCTCGGMAVVIGSNDYKGQMSPTNNGKLFVCYIHQNTGRHVDGST